MKKALLGALLISLAGCGVELLTTTAIQGELQAQQLQAMKGQVSHASYATAKINIQRAIDTYNAEKGQYPATLEDLVPAFLPSLPKRPDGQSYGYDPVQGKVLDSAAAPGPVSRGPTPSDTDKMNQIRAAIDRYGRTTGYYPPSLAALAPTYMPAVPKTDSGQDFVFYPQTGALLHPAQLNAPQAGTAPAFPQPQPAQPRPAGAGMGGVGPMGEVITGIGMQNQLNSMGQSGASAAGGYARDRLGGATQQHNAQQEQVLNSLGM